MLKSSKQMFKNPVFAGRLSTPATASRLLPCGVMVVGTEIGALTKADGTFCLSLPVQQGTVRLQVQRFGFAVQDIQNINKKNRSRHH